MECKQRSATAAAESERLRSVVRQLELLLLCREAELTSIREETTAVATRNNICHEALQSALAIVDVRDNRQEVVQVQLWFVSWYCKSFGLAIAAFEDQAAAVSEVMNTWMEAMRSQRDKHQKEAERVDRELALLEEGHKRTRTTDAALQKRRSSLRLLAAALRFFRCRLQGRAAAVRSERVQWEAELSTARKAHEDRRLTRRLLLLQKEAREGLCAEELLTRGMLTNNEDGERREVVCQKQLDMDMLKEQQLQAGESQRRCEGENETVNDCYGQETPAKPAARRRRAAVHTDKRQLGVQSKLTSQVQKAFPNCSKAISPHDNNTQQSSWKRVRDTSPDVTTSSQPFLITRTLVNPFDSLNHRREASGDRNESPLPRQAMTNMPLNDKDNGKKRHQLRNGLHVPTGRLSQINDSPLPRLPNGKNAPVHRDLAPKNVNVVTKATSAVNLGSDPPEVSSQHRARPSLLIEKDTWSSGKSEDIFADIFPF
uniref:Uncharacterized protein TCIL3000_7_2920 n=1 Tax=Trypanosoma congolense (strain IL3000) TaxID=1068625 RepID=G0UQ17_TRYCI|nr:unnamed protein product [Trypanosoma congolense IL3000]